MATSTPISRQEYLRTSFHPDREWVEGEVRERNTGDGLHASVQGFFVTFFAMRKAALNIRVYPELRTQVQADRFRIPDVAVLRADAPYEEIVTVPPLLCIEVLSPDDRMSEMRDKVEDYLGMGVAAVWVVDPRRREAFVATVQGMVQVRQLSLERPSCTIPFSDVFAELDRFMP